MSTFVFLLLLIRDIFLQSPQDTKVIGSLTKQQRWRRRGWHLVKDDFIISLRKICSVHLLASELAQAKYL